MPTGLNNDKHDFSRMDGFVNARLSAPGNVLAFMDARTQEPALQEQDETPKASASVYDMNGPLTQQDMIAVKFYGRAGSALSTTEEDMQKVREEREKKDRESVQTVQQQARLLERLTSELSQYKEQHSQTMAELTALRREIRESERRSELAAEKFEKATDIYEAKSAETKSFQEEMEGKTVTINGIEITMENGILVDQDGKAISKEDLSGSKNPMSVEMQDYLQDQIDKQIAARTQAGASMAQSDADIKAQKAKEEAQPLEEKAQELIGKIEDTEGKIQEIQESNPELSAVSEIDTPKVADIATASNPPGETEQPIVIASAEVGSSSPRTVSAIGETNFVEDNSVKAPNMRGEFKVRAEGTAVDAPETPDANADKNLGQTADLAAAQNNQQFAMTQLRPLGMGTA